MYILGDFFDGKVKPFCPGTIAVLGDFTNCSMFWTFWDHIHKRDINMKKKKNALLALCLATALAVQLSAQTTGKISGSVFDQLGGQPLIGADVLVEGTVLGAATGMDGSFFIINIPPGVYNLQIRMMGYNTQRLEAVRVSVNRTSEVSVRLEQQVLEGEVVVVQAEKLSLKKDQTSSIRNVSADAINMLPVEDTGSVIGLQAGVVGGHFRGGRVGEVSYMIDGLQVDNAFDRQQAVAVDKDAIQDMEVITGTFNAEYGRAMSGIVNLVTKEGGNRFHGKVEGLVGNYFTGHDDIFVGLEASEITRNQDYKLQLEGPLIRDRLSFYSNIRTENNKNHIAGIRRFSVTDSSIFSAGNIYSEASGDGAYIPMNDNKSLKGSAKLTYKGQSFRSSLSYLYNDDDWQVYENEYLDETTPGGAFLFNRTRDHHLYKYNPDGAAGYHKKTHRVALQANHMFSRSAFYELKLSWLKSDDGYYLFENPLDPNYISDRYRTNNVSTGFFTGGQEKEHVKNSVNRIDAKLDLTWQMNKNHSLKMGGLLTLHQFDHAWHVIRNAYEQTPLEATLYAPSIQGDSTLFGDIYEKSPYEFSTYVQDKMEFDEMVINIGVRLDYLDPKTTVPSQRRNPDNVLEFDEPERMSTYEDAEAQYQVSPRLGLSYQLGNTAILHFSYGHFFQPPSFQNTYLNNSFLVGPVDYAITMGNAQVKAEKTISYEVGLFQELSDGMNLDVAVFYRDIYDLMTVNIITTYNQIQYGLYGNRDYGNARGLEVKYDLFMGNFSTMINYTLQYTRGNANNPLFTFTRAGQSMDPVPRLIPMRWDQRHTFNVTTGYSADAYAVTLTANYGSGMPYTYRPMEGNPLTRVNLYSNNDSRPAIMTLDMLAFYDFVLAGNKKLRVSLRGYNLLDRLNEYEVYNTTGRAGQDIVRESQLSLHTSDFNDYYDRLKNPSQFGPPRMIKFGLGLIF